MSAPPAMPNRVFTSIVIVGSVLAIAADASAQSQHGVRGAEARVSLDGTRVAESHAVAGTDASASAIADSPRATTEGERGAGPDVGSGGAGPALPVARSDDDAATSDSRGTPSRADLPLERTADLPREATATEPLLVRVYDTDITVGIRADAPLPDLPLLREYDDPLAAGVRVDVPGPWSVGECVLGVFTLRIPREGVRPRAPLLPLVNRDGTDHHRRRENHEFARHAPSVALTEIVTVPAVTILPTVVVSSTTR